MEPAAAARKRILIVDDDTAVREALTCALEDAYDIETAGNGTTALSLLPLFQPDLILLDLKMRGLDGIQTLEEIRCGQRALPVIIVTGWSSQEWAERAADLGVSGYLKKPPDLDQLIGRIAEVFRTNDQTTEIAPASMLIPEESSHPLVRKTLAYLHRNFARQLTLRGVAAAVEVTPAHLCRLFRQEVGSTPMGYLTGLRIERAKVLLRDGVRPVSQVAFQIGFAHPHHFSRVFKARTGSAPARFR
jgi:YesN/AraC family two-component response regulator